jgi:hypothetical protein
LNCLKVKSKQGNVFEVSEIEEKLGRIEKNERKLEALYARVDTLEMLSSRDISGNSLN